MNLSNSGTLSLSPCYCCLVAKSCLSLLWPHGLKPTRLLSPRDFPDQNTAVGCHFLLQGIFPTQGSNPGLLHCRQILYHLSHQGSPNLKIHSAKKEKKNANYHLTRKGCHKPSVWKTNNNKKKLSQAGDKPECSPSHNKYAKVLKERIREPWKETSNERDREAVLLTSTDPRNLEARGHHQMLSEMHKVL